KREFDRENFTKLLYAIMVISFRYNTIGAYSPAELERAYNNVVEHINKKKITNSNQALGLLKSVYIDDQRFSRDFTEKVIKTTDSRSTQLVRFILCEIGCYISNSVEVDFSSDTFNIEHVLPQNAPDNWGDFSYEEMNALTYRLGNMTLLQSNSNRDLGVAEYSQKREIFKESHFVLTQKLAEKYTEWTPQTISSWQGWLATQAKTIWRVAQLS
ncbi:MAG: HNH endonuclease family protein, partial [[Pasteurella] aerogenes]|nr:HNH endonuclease family protein [[Pasteurella] aerogenes]